MTLHATVAQVTARIAQRSHALRAAYLQQVEEAASRKPGADRLGCANVAHAFAAMPPADKSRASGLAAIPVVSATERGPNIGVVNAYNDLLSAHAPLQHYPDIVKDEARKWGSTAQVAGGVPAMCDGVTQGFEGMELSLFSLDTIAMSTAVALSHDVTQWGYSGRLHSAVNVAGVVTITLDMEGAPGNMFGGTLGRLTLINSGNNDIKIYTPGSLRLDHIDTGTGALDLRASDIRQSNASASVKMRGTVTSNNTELIFDAPITLDAPLSINSGTGTLKFNSTLAAGTNALSLKADALDLSGATLSGSSVALTTSTAGKSIVLGSTSDSSAMAISTSDFTKLMGMDSLSIGDSTSTNPITVSSALTVSKPMTVTITAGGSFTVNDQITVSNSDGLTINGGTITLNGGSAFATDGVYNLIGYSGTLNGDATLLSLNALNKDAAKARRKVVDHHRCSDDEAKQRICA